MFVTLTLSPAIDNTVTVQGPFRNGGVHAVLSETLTPGGKGVNVAKTLAAAGASVCAGGLLGLDRLAQYESFLNDLGVDTLFLAVDEATRVNTMIVSDDGGEMKFNRVGFPALEADWSRLTAYCDVLAQRGTVFILSGSTPARYPADTYARLVALFRSQGKTVVLDAGGESLLRGAPGASLLKPNRQELTALCGGRALDSEARILDECKRLARGRDGIVVSDGPNGAYFVCGQQALHASAPRVRAIDSTGAGDALLGQFCAEFYPARQLTQAVAARAVAAGSAATEVRGTPLIPLARVEQLVREVNIREI